MLPPVVPVLAKYLAIALLSNAALPRSTFSTHGTFPNGFFSFKYAALLFVVPITHSACSSVSSFTPANRAAAAIRCDRVVLPYSLSPIAPKTLPRIASNHRRSLARAARSRASVVDFRVRVRSLRVRSLARGRSACATRVRVTFHSPTRRGGGFRPIHERKT